MDHVPDRDAGAVARLKGAGAIVFGKTNLPLYAGDLQTFNQPFGVTNNPWDTDPHPRRLVRRLGRRPRGRPHPAGAGLRHRRLHPQPLPPVRDGRASSPRSRRGPQDGYLSGPRRPLRTLDVNVCRPDGPHGRRPRSSPSTCSPVPGRPDAAAGDERARSGRLARRRPRCPSTPAWRDVLTGRGRRPCRAEGLDVDEAARPESTSPRPPTCTSSWCTRR